MGIPLIATIEGSVEASLLILATIIVVGPLVAERLHAPGLIGLILGGMVVGPFMLGWESIGGLISALGSIGLLYLMFLAGLSFNLKSFAENRTSAVVYGLLGFFIPFTLSFVVAMLALGYSALAAALIGAMWASNTLVAYPEAQAAGLADNRAVGTAVSAGVIADVFSLMVLAVVSSAEILGDDPTLTASNPDPALPLWLGMLILGVFTLWVLPRITLWFFVRVGHTRTQRFVFVLGGMAAGAVVALIGGMEGLIGAFLAGLGMNRLIPGRGPLMQRIEFFGAALFIPAFLVSIGLTIDPRALLDLETVGLALLFTGLVVVGKGIAALITSSRFKYSSAETGIIAALSMGQAASTLAIAQVGISLGLFDQQVVNAAILTIVATAFISSYGTRFFATKIDRPVPSRVPLGHRVLVDVRAQGTELQGLINLAGALATSDDGVILPYAVATSGQAAVAEAQVAESVNIAERLGLDTEGDVRVGESFAADTLSLVEEEDGSALILTWQGPRFPSDYMFGNEINLIGQHSPIPTIAAHILGPWERIVVATGDFEAAWLKEDVAITFATARRVRYSGRVPVSVITPDREAVAAEVKRFGDADVIEAAVSSGGVLDALQPHDLLIVPSHVARRTGAVNTWRLARALRGVSVAVVAGPGRLGVTQAGVATRVHGIVGPTG